MERKEHERIWLEPACADDAPEGRQWCQDNVWGEYCSDCGQPAVEYVRADIVERLRREVAAFRRLADVSLVQVVDAELTK